MNAPGLQAALERAGIGAHDPEFALARFGMTRHGGGDGALLEGVRATWQTETHGGEGVILLTREGLTVVLAPVSKGFLRGKSDPGVQQIPFERIRDFIGNDDEGSIIFFFGAQGGSDFVLTFGRVAERDRFLRPLFGAHRGDFSLWSPGLDPTQVQADFRRFLALLEADGPATDSGLHGWAEEHVPQYEIANAVGLAANWRGAVLADANGWSPSRRVGMLGNPWAWIIDRPDARRVFVDLGEGLYDAGLLAAPFDERSFDTGDPLSQHDAGPARLIGLLTLAALAHHLRDPRAEEFVGAARAGISQVPPAVFSPRLRELWADLGPLP